MSALRRTLLCLIVLAALVVASLTAEPGDWPRAIAWAEARALRAADAAPDCPVLIGAPREGVARDGYERAARLAASVSDEARTRLEELLGVGLAAPVDVAADDAEAAWRHVPDEAFEAFRAAARSRQGVYVDANIGARHVDYIALFDLFPIVDALLLRAHHAAAERDRVEWLLDAVAGAADIAAAEAPVASVLGTTLLERALRSVTDEWLRGLSVAARRQLASALAEVDAVVPESEPVALAAVHMVRLLRDHDDLEPDELGVPSRLHAWRNGFSLWREGLARASSLVAGVRAFELETPSVERWPARRARLVALAARYRAAHPGSHAGLLDHVVEFETQRRRALAELRLLRIALAFHLDESLPKLGDPLGAGTLDSRVLDGELRAASATGLRRTARR